MAAEFHVLQDAFGSLLIHRLHQSGLPKPWQLFEACVTESEASRTHNPFDLLCVKTCTLCEVATLILSTSAKQCAHAVRPNLSNLSMARRTMPRRCLSSPADRRPPSPHSDTLRLFTGSHNRRAECPPPPAYPPASRKSRHLRPRARAHRIRITLIELAKPPRSRLFVAPDRPHRHSGGRASADRCGAGHRPAPEARSDHSAAPASRLLVLLPGKHTRVGRSTSGRNLPSASTVSTRRVPARQTHSDDRPRQLCSASRRARSRRAEIIANPFGRLRLGAGGFLGLAIVPLR